MQASVKEGFRSRLDDFLRSPQYVLSVMLLTVLSFILQGEVVLYTIFAAIVVYLVVRDDDLLPITPLLLGGYLAPSSANNPGRNPDSVFTGASGLYILALGAVILLALAWFILRHRDRFFRGKRQLLLGLLLLSGAYLLSGIGSEGYGALVGKNLVFALLQIAALILPYWILSGGINWKKARHDYFAWVGACVGAVVALELLWIYLSGGVIESGVIVRTNIYTGWGMHNNIGILLAMTIPFVFYLAFSYRKGWLGIVTGLFYLLALCFSTSRTSAIIGAVCYGACCVLMVFFGRRRKRNLYVVLSIAALILVCIIFFADNIMYLFSEILDDTQELDSRFTIYKNGLQEFMRNPIFGTSFYPAEGLSWSWSTTSLTQILPARWHNTIIQLLASTGVVGLAAYGFHRYQTIRLASRLKGRRQVLFVFAMAVLLLGSMADCHFFNLGPTLFYSVLLARTEFQEI